MRNLPFLLVLFAVSFLPGSGTAQSDQKVDDPTAGQQGSSSTESTDDQAAGSANKDSTEEVTKTDEAFERFTQAKNQLLTNEQRINNLIVNMPIGFPEKTEKFKLQIAQLKNNSNQVAQILTPAAIESFENFPGQHEEITNHLLRILQLQLSGQQYRNVPFNPFDAMKSYQRLVDGGIETPTISLLGYQLNFLLNDFEAARLLLFEANARGHQGAQPVLDQLRIITGKWMRELRLRKADAESNVPRVKIELDVGDVVVELFEDQAPNTVANFVSLVEAGFYDGMAFNQVSPKDAAMAGSPTVDGLGGPGYAIKDECEGENIRHHFTGVISMFPVQKDGGGSQFLITKQPQPKLDGKITAFGRVVEGLENVYKIKVVDRTRGVAANSPLPTEIKKMTVLSKRDHEYKPEKITAPSVGSSSR